MGLTLHQRPSGPVVDDAQVVHEPKECNPPLDDAQLVDEPKERDPHVIPTFTSESLTKASSTILCHPPLLSSLPQDPSVPPVSIGRPPETCPLHKWNPPLDDTQLVDEAKERDPHVIPTFTSDSLTKASSTILYLPPLLSSLPQDLSVPAVSIDRPPLVTETRLPDIDPVSLSLHKALHHFRPLSDDYAALPYALAFNWPELDLPEDEEREWYAVVFRSLRKKGSDSGRK
jgi:hypothetical protein